MTELHAGSFLGRYELLVRIGHGGMASVWVARLRASNGGHRYVALKAMLPELAEHSKFRAMFLDEVQIVHSIDHANVVRVYEVSEDNGVLYMVMEWVEGDSLRNLIRQAKRRGAIPADIAVRLVSDTAAGLHAAHELRGWEGELRRVVHCDVSPHNILVGLDGVAKVVDFGIANALGSLESGGQLKGKLSYMSPEQARGEALDRRSDLFSLGIVLYELATGEQLFKGRDASHTLELVARAEIPRPSSVSPQFPPSLEPVVMKALERDPNRRFQTSEEFGQALDAHLVRERVLVSHAAVAKLLERVVGKRIEKRREVIASISRALDAETGGSGPPAGSEFLTLGYSSWPTESGTGTVSSTSLPASDSALGVAARTTTDGGMGLATSQGRASTTTRLLRWMIPVLVVAGTAVIGISLLNKRGSSNGSSFEAASDAPAAPTTAPEPANEGAPPAAGAGPTGTSELSVDSLPLVRTGTPSPADPQGAPVQLTASPSNVAGSGSETGDVAPAEVDLRRQPPIDVVAARHAMTSAASAAGSCRSRGETTGSGRAMVTFRADGSVSQVSISAPFSGTRVGSCVQAHFRNTRIPPYDGESVTLSKRFTVSAR